MTRVVIACDKFKGSLSADKVADAVSCGLVEGSSRFVSDVFPIADGGEGTLDAFIRAGFTEVLTRAKGPTGQLLETRFAYMDQTAVVELADICGMSRLPNMEVAPLTSSTFGLGQVVGEVLDRGFKKVVLGVGGSASTDGGAGLATALGAVIKDANGVQIDGTGGSLSRAHSLDISRLHPAVGSAEFVLASDVQNPLLGSSGAAALYGKQKGATKSDRLILENGLRVWSELVEDCLDASGLSRAPGSGAAGGTGFGAMAFLGAKMESGVEVVMDLLGFDEFLDGSALVVTGEGSLDAQTLHGKAVHGVTSAAMRKAIPVVAVCGVNSLTTNQIEQLGLWRVIALNEIESDLERCKTAAYELLMVAGERIGNLLMQ